jgi:hypothetical protein
MASCTIHGRSFYIGTYDTVEEAAAAYEETRRRLMPQQGDTV